MGGGPSDARVRDAMRRARPDGESLHLVGAHVFDGNPFAALHGDIGGEGDTSLEFLHTPGPTVRIGRKIEGVKIKAAGTGITLLDSAWADRCEVLRSPEMLVFEGNHQYLTHCRSTECADGVRWAQASTFGNQRIDGLNIVTFSRAGWVIDGAAMYDSGKAENVHFYGGPTGILLQPWEGRSNRGALSNLTLIDFDWEQVDELIRDAGDWEGDWERHSTGREANSLTWVNPRTGGNTYRESMADYGVSIAYMADWTIIGGRGVFSTPAATGVFQSRFTPGGWLWDRQEQARAIVEGQGKTLFEVMT
jgi:hypothetical protein